MNIGDFFTKNIVSDLSPANDALHPILKLDAIKFIWQFRGHLTKADLVSAFPQLMHLVASHNHVLHTYAAMAVERILAIQANGSLMFTLEDLRTVVGPLCDNLIKLIKGKKTAEKMAENDLLMKALMRVMLLAQSELLAPNAQMLIAELTDILWAVSKNPSNPRFTHYLFESIATLVRFCAPDPSLLSIIEAKLCPVLQEILQADQTDFIPYVFQLYAGLVEYRNGPGLAGYSTGLIPIILQPTLWNTQGTVPALVRFLQACIFKDPQSVPVQSILGISQVLIGSRVNDLHAFTLINTVITTASPQQLESYLGPILLMMLKKLQSVKISRISSSVLLTICDFTTKLPPSFVFNQFEKIQPGMIIGLMKTVLLPEAGKLRDRNDRNVCLLGLCKLAFGCPEFLSKVTIDQNYSSLFMTFISACLAIISNIPTTTAASTTAEVKIPVQATEGPAIDELGTSYASLQSLPLPPRFPPVQVDPTTGFVNGIAGVSKSIPVRRMICEAGGLDAGQQAILQQLLQQRGQALTS